MSGEVGVGLIVGGVALLLVTVFTLWRGVSGPVAFGLLAGAGLAVGAGALLVQDHAGAGDWIITLAFLGVLTPVHMRFVFGRPGRGFLPNRPRPRRKAGDPMTQRTDDAGPAAEPPVASPGQGGMTSMSPAVAVGRPRLARKGRPRQTRVVITKVGPWSVFKFSLLFYFCIMLVMLLALGILYGLLGAIGALDSVTKLTRELFTDQSFQIHGGWIFTRLIAIGFAIVVLWSFVNLFVAFLYNLISDVVGGIEVTLAQRQ